MLNRCEFIGNLGSDPEVKTLADGTKVANFSIGVTERAFKTSTGKEVPAKTEWISLELWRGLADIAEKYLAKGNKVFISGKMATSSYEKDGVTKFSTKIVVSDMELLTPKAPLAPGTATGAAPTDNFPF